MRITLASLLASTALAVIVGCRSTPAPVGRIVHGERWRSGVPLGGLGCGKIEMLTDGAFGNFTIAHNRDHPTDFVRGTFFGLRHNDETTLLRLQRPGEYEGVKNVDDVLYNGFFPRALLAFSGLPVGMDMEAFSPLIPQNAEDSSLPVALFAVRLSSKRPETCTVLFSWENLLGGPCEPVEIGSWYGLRFTSAPGRPPNLAGECMILTDGVATVEKHWDASAGMIGREVALAPYEPYAVRFAVVWFMPQSDATEDADHYYLNRFAGAHALAQYATENVDRFYHESRIWSDLVLVSSLPDWLRAMMLNHAYPAFADTIFTQNGRFSLLGTMEQRMAAQAFWTAMFPDLDRRELELPRDDVRPDASCAWVVQVLKNYRWTGDRAFFDRMWPRVKQAMAWLRAQDTDGDLIPEGGNPFDDSLPRGSFMYTASCYLAALRASAEMAHQAGEPADFAELFPQVQAKVIDRLWDESQGTFMAWRGSDQEIRQSLAVALAGDWLARSAGLEPILPADKIESAVRETLARHVKSFPRLPPLRVTADGRLGAPTSFPIACESFLGCEAIYQGYVQDGLETIRRVYETAWELDRNPWDVSFAYDARHGYPMDHPRPVSASAVWNVLPALAGTTVDLTRGTLHFKPNGEYHGPLFFPTFWAWLDCAPGAARIHVLQVFKPHTFVRVNDAERRLEVQPNAVWDLSEFATIAPAKTAAAKFPLPAPEGKKWSVKTCATSPFDPSPLSLERATDGDSATCWRTDRPMQSGDWFEVDLLERRALKGLKLDFAGSPEGWPRGLRVEVSDDDARWTTACEMDVAAIEKAQTAGVLNIPFQARGRYLRLTQLGTSDYPWAIHELDVAE
ncbi:MAG: discoidin domain-containing protein [Planctomycetes bacterium]|nr:discoidin domain-containing protein [Planctomycetota bacterium]